MERSEFSDLYNTYMNKLVETNPELIEYPCILFDVIYKNSKMATSYSEICYFNEKNLKLKEYLSKPPYKILKISSQYNSSKWYKFLNTLHVLDLYTVGEIDSTIISYSKLSRKWIEFETLYEDENCTTCDILRKAPYFNLIFHDKITWKTFKSFSSFLEDIRKIIVEHILVQKVTIWLDFSNKEIDIPVGNYILKFSDIKWYDDCERHYKIEDTYSWIECMFQEFGFRKRSNRYEVATCLDILPRKLLDILDYIDVQRIHHPLLELLYKNLKKEVPGLYEIISNTGKSYYFNYNVLMENSEYFVRLFNNDMKIQDKEAIPLSDYVLDYYQKYLYHIIVKDRAESMSGIHIPDNFDLSEIMSLFHFMDYYAIKEENFGIELLIIVSSYVNRFENVDELLKEIKMITVPKDWNSYKEILNSLYNIL